MIKENIGFRLAAVKKSLTAAKTKVRYKAFVILENVSKNTRRTSTYIGTKVVEKTVNLAEATLFTSKKTFLNLRGSFNTLAISTRDKIINNKKRVALGAVTACAFVICSISAFNAATAYEYSYNGEVLGVVKEPTAVYKGVKEAEETLTQEIGAKVVIDTTEDIKMKRIFQDNEKVNQEKDVVNALTSIEEIKVEAWAINITDTEGNTTTHSIYMDTKKNANQVLEDVKAEFTKNIKPEELVDASFEEKVKVEKIKIKAEEMIDTSAAFDFIMTGGVEKKIHKVKKGDSVASISEKYDVSRENIKKWNPEIGDDNILYLNQEILLQEQIPLLNVVIKKNITFNEDFGPEVVYDDTDTLYKEQEIVTKKGKSGNRTVNADIIEKNGKIIDRIDLNYTVHKDQKIRKVMRGTKERPDKIGKGYYFTPMEGRFTSPFGKRWGRSHEGIDLAGPVGTDVYAADAGVVTEAGATSSGYGIAVKIDHGNGRTTYYAHNSKVLVKVGETVYRGQHIAESGNTGRSTGPHLHFETRFDGVAKNPMKYL